MREYLLIEVEIIFRKRKFKGKNARQYNILGFALYLLHTCFISGSRRVLEHFSNNCRMLLESLPSQCRSSAVPVSNKCRPALTPGYPSLSFRRSRFLTTKESQLNREDHNNKFYQSRIIRR